MELVVKAAVWASPEDTPAIRCSLERRNYCISPESPMMISHDGHMTIMPHDSLMIIISHDSHMMIMSYDSHMIPT